MSELAFQSLATRWGSFGYVTRGGRLVATYLPQARQALVERAARDFPEATRAGASLGSFEGDVRRYFLGEQVCFSASVDLSGMSPFWRAVLEACRRIPYGQTASYADLARSAGSPRAVRAAGGAMAHNPLPLVIPCHRVLRSDGSIGGFSSVFGIEEKVRLLELEGVEVRLKSGGLLRRAV